jgi:gas vesicle protein
LKRRHDQFTPHEKIGKKEILQMDTKIFLGYIFAFLSGLAIGALTALLLAPASGVETRSQIREKADASGQQIKAGYEQSRQWATEQTGRLRGDKQDEGTPNIQ